MRSKFYLLVVMVIVLLTGSTLYADVVAGKNLPESDDGRYQLFQGSYTSIDLKRQQTSTHNGIFLIDTRSGKVKRYLNKIDEQGRYIETWVPTDLPAEK
ncbi:MAG: hypothetical protein HY880_08260 [Deltaproteobacteria bacterium]|nr:hypothetical protein [Deltaproteobacteria bacterium]